MRWPLVLVIAFAAACDWPMGTSGASGGGGGDAGVPCSQGNDCPTCQSCALNWHCSSLWAACMANPSCLSIDGCVVNCTDASCFQSCYAQNPAGATAYQAVHSCIYCEQCPCAGKCF